jgi:hypothetical protein
MLAKLTALLSSKAALAALGIVLVGGATATTVAATTGHLGPIETPHIGAKATHAPENEDAQGVHAHTISIQGLLTTITTCPSTITKLTLTDAKVSPEHTEQDDDAAKATKTPGAEATENTAKVTKTPGAEATENSTKDNADMTAVSGPVTVAITKDTRVTGADVHALGDLCHHLKERVEAQTTKGSNGAYTAWKVTALGGGQDTTGSNNSSAAQDVTAQGTIKALNLAKASFTLTTASGDVTVMVNAKTEFEGNVHTLAQTKAGAHVTVRGLKQADGSIVASKITVEADH